MPDMYWIWDEKSLPIDTRIVIARIGLHPFRQGHIQELYPCNWKFSWKEKAKFFLVKIQITKVQFDKFIEGRALQLKFKQSEGGFLSENDLQKHLNNLNYKTKEDFESNGIQPKIDITDPVIDLSLAQKAQVCDAPLAWRDSHKKIEGQMIP